MAHTDELVQMTTEKIERRNDERRRIDSWKTGLLVGCIGMLVGFGIALGKASESLDRKLDRDVYYQARGVDSVGQVYRDRQLNEINRKLDELLCRYTPTAPGCHV